MFNFIKKLFGTKYDRDIKGITPLVEKINAEYAKLSGLGNDQLRAKTYEFRTKIQNYLSAIQSEIDQAQANAKDTEDIGVKEGLFKRVDELMKERDKAVEEVLNDILPEAFAVVKEAARRLTENETLTYSATAHDREVAANCAKKGDSYCVIEGDNAIWRNSWNAAGNQVKWNMVHYDVQLIGGIVLHQGKIAEMATGEGKTLVATLPAYLNALPGFGIHIVTVNNYLARRDAEWNGPLFQMLGLTVDCIDNYEPHSDGRIKAYRADITYGTNNEFGFDYLRDNMVRSKDELVQRKFHYAMVDEVDSVLIDDARTPLIISGPVQRDEQTQLFESLKPRVESLVEAQRNLFNKYLNEARNLIDQGNTGVNEGEGGLALLRAYRALPKNRALIKYLSESGIQTILRKTENHYMAEQSKHMPKVDEPLFFVIEEKQRNVELRDNGVELLTKMGNDPNLYIIPDIGAELAEIDKNIELDEKDKVAAKDERISFFNEKTELLHSIDQMLKAYTLFTKDDEYVVMDGLVKIVDEQTGRIMEGRRYSDGLHQAIEAKEGVKIEKATQTYATITLQNFFRMYHKLAGMTGTAITEDQEFWQIYKLDVVVIPTNRDITRKDLDDKIYKTDKEKYNAVIDEIEALREQGRPILVGTTSVQYSELLGRLLTMRKIPHNVLNAKQHQREAEIVQEAGKAGTVTIATNMAGRGTDIKLGPGVKDSGGLAIIGTERHQSRRVDRQLRGRAGRQGDPGTSQFFVSLEDPLMRLFGSEKISGWMDRFGHKEGDVLEHSMLTSSVERAQRKVEENNFGIRKRLLEYDDVMNVQRSAIYKMRNNALSGERLSIDLSRMFYNLGRGMVMRNKSANSFENFQIDIFHTFGVESPFTEEEFKKKGNDQQLVDAFHDFILDHYKGRVKHLAESVLPVIKDVHSTQGNQYKNIAIPFTDGKKGMDFSANMEEAIATDGRSIASSLEQGITLSMIDHNWKDHLRVMDELKDSVQSAQFEQKDPLVIYKTKAYEQFEVLIREINTEVASFLFKGGIPMGSPEDVRQAKQPQRSRVATNTNRTEEDAARDAAQNAGQELRRVETIKRNEPKIGRNDPCPCGSGKKFKSCHGVGI